LLYTGGRGTRFVSSVDSIGAQSAPVVALNLVYKLQPFWYTGGRGVGEMSALSITSHFNPVLALKEVVELQPGEYIGIACTMLTDSSPLSRKTLKNRIFIFIYLS
jgi:hypothetical protein